MQSLLSLGKVLTLGLWLLLSLAGCQADAPGPVVIEFWAMGREGEVVRELLPAFEQRYPHIRVKLQQIPWSAAHEKLLTAYAGDAMPDVFQVGNTWIPEFVALRAVEPLDAWIAGSKALDKHDYFPGILATNEIDETTYGVPWYVDTRLLFYRTDLLAQAGVAELPRTWSDWRAALERIKVQAGDSGYAILLPLNEWQAPVILALQSGAELLRDNARYGNFQSLPFRQAFHFYLELFRRRLTPAVGEAQVTNLYQEFASGYFSMYISGPWNIGEFNQRLPATLRQHWSTAPLPGPGAEYPSVSLAGGASLAIFRGCAYKEAAWALVEFLSETRQQVEFYRLTGDLPSRQSAWREAALVDNPPTQAFWLQLQTVATTPKIPEWERIANRITQYAEAAVRGTLSEDAALAALDRDVDLILEKRRWLLR